MATRDQRNVNAVQALAEREPVTARRLSTRRPRPRNRDVVAALVRHEAFARQAFDTWVRRGCPAGSELERWLDTEERLSKIS